MACSRPLSNGTELTPVIIGFGPTLALYRVSDTIQSPPLKGLSSPNQNMYPGGVFRAEHAPVGLFRVQAALAHNVSRLQNPSRRTAQSQHCGWPRSRSRPHSHVTNSISKTNNDK
eukprot:3799272-Rhodomonas_salina.2